MWQFRLYTLNCAHSVNKTTKISKWFKHFNIYPNKQKKLKQMTSIRRWWVETKQMNEWHTHHMFLVQVRLRTEALRTQSYTSSSTTPSCTPSCTPSSTWLGFELMTSRSSLSLHLFFSHGPSGRHKCLGNQLPPFLTTLRLSQGIAQLQSCPLLYVVLPSLLLSASLPSSWYCAL